MSETGPVYTSDVLTPEMRERYLTQGMGSHFSSWFTAMQGYVHDLATRKGWWREEREDGTVIALIHEEVSESLRALRNGGRQYSEKIPNFLEIEEELADVVIRIMDFAQKRGWRVGEAIVAKTAFNEKRPYRHGGKAF